MKIWENTIQEEEMPCVRALIPEYASGAPQTAENPE